MTSNNLSVEYAGDYFRIINILTEEILANIMKSNNYEDLDPFVQYIFSSEEILLVHEMLK